MKSVKYVLQLTSRPYLEKILYLKVSYGRKTEKQLLEAEKNRAIFLSVFAPLIPSFDKLLISTVTIYF